MGTSGERGFLIPRRYWGWLGTRRAVAVLLWLITVGTAIHHFVHARAWFDTPPDAPDFLRRADGNNGHALIDFGGQWVMGRMLVLGHGRELYHRQRQWEVVRAGLPEEDEAPIQQRPWDYPDFHPLRQRAETETRHDAERMMIWFMGNDPRAQQVAAGAAVLPLAASPLDPPLVVASYAHTSVDTVTPEVVAEVERPAIGGPLYPPVHAFLYAPIGLFDRPRGAYPVFQAFAVALAFTAGLGLCFLTQRKVWWSVCTLAVLLFPGCRSAFDLAQNPTLTLTITVWGWVLAARGRDVAGGLVWGLFAFKPVWALAFFLVPLLMGRWRFCVAMVGTGAALGLMTLPVVGVQTWFDWLAVGQEAAALYNVNENWIHLSRDLQGIPRRFLIDFGLPEARRDTPTAKLVAWSLWAVVFGSTVLIYRLRASRRPVGLGAGFLFLGAFLTCYRFMYYDVMLALVGVAALFTEPGRLFRTRVFDIPTEPVSPLGAGGAAGTPHPFGPRLTGYLNSFPLTVLLVLYLLDNLILQWGMEATVAVGAWPWHSTPDDGGPPRIVTAFSLSYPWDTGLIMALWGWCGFRLLRGDERSGVRSDLAHT